MSCPPNMKYSASVSGCPATCMDPYPNPLSCMFPPTEGCQCNHGYVLSGEGCAPLEQCGCQTKVGYIPVSINAHNTKFTDKNILVGISVNVCLLENRIPSIYPSINISFSQTISLWKIKLYCLYSFYLSVVKCVFR